MKFQKFAKSQLARELWNELDWTTVVQAFQSTSVNQRNRFVAAIKTRRVDEVARAVISIVSDKIEADVQTEYESIIADGTLSQAEINRLFGES